MKRLSGTNYNGVKISQEYSRLVSKISDIEFESLKESIASEYGPIVPIILNRHGVILDGLHRFRACRDMGIPVQ